MSQENIELARRAVALGNACDLEAAAELYHPDVEAHAQSRSGRVTTQAPVTA